MENDDRKFITLMDAYKQLRREKPEEARKLREKAQALAISGNVSSDAIEFVRY